MLKALVTASIAALLTGTAFAGPVDDANAHFKAIAAGDAALAEHATAVHLRQSLRHVLATLP